MLKFDLSGTYTPPDGHSVRFELAGLSFDFEASYTPPDGHNVLFDLEPYSPPLAPDILIKCYGSRWERAEVADSSTLAPWQKAEPINVVTGVKNKPSIKLNTNWLIGIFKRMVNQDVITKCVYGLGFDRIDNDWNLDRGSLIPAKDRLTKFRTDVYDKLSTVTAAVYNVPLAKDVVIKSPWYSVNLAGEQRQKVIHQYPGRPVGNVINFNFDTAPITTPLTFDFNVSQPAPNDDTPVIEKVVYLSGRLQPTGTNFITYAGKAVNQVQFTKSLKWGYGENNFLIGGVWKSGYTVEPPEPPVPPIVHPDYGVYRIVNIVNMYLLPEMTPVGFESLSINYDIDSFCWTVNFNVVSRQDYNLIKPVGRYVKEVMVSINGDNFKFFVGKINRRISADSNTGRVTETFNCQGWSNLKKLANPYSAKSSYTDTTSTTGAQAVIEIAQANNFTADWDTVDWNIPENVHSYQNQTPIGAILQIVRAIGGVVIPNKDTDGFKVRSRFPVSPWDWDNLNTFPDREVHEGRFFSIDNDTVPRTNPDGIYVMGNSIGVKAVRNGKPGTDLLPDVIDKYITTVTAGQERARVEVANNSFLEVIPMETYIDENGMIEPLDLIEFTTMDDEKWRGMVMSVNINCQRIGTGIVQKITVARFFDD